MSKVYASLKACAVLAGNPIALGAVSDGALPVRLKIFEWGMNEGRTTGAKIIVNETTVEKLNANQHALAHDTVALDYEHQTVPGHDAYKDPPHHVAAHGVIEVVEGDGVYLSSVDYTPNGKEYAANYPDVSPVAFTNDKNELIFIHSVALTQSGDVAGLSFAKSDSLSSLLITKNQTETSMKYKEMLVQLLNLKPSEGESEVSDEAIAAAIAAKEGGAKPLASEDSKPVESTDEMKALSARFDKIEKDRLTDQASQAGKIIPLSAADITKTPLSVLTAMVEKLPAGQVVTESKTKGEKPGAESVVALSADQKEICKELGVSEEDYQKQLKAKS